MWALRVCAFGLWHVFGQKKMSKDFEKVPIVVVLAHFENILISKIVFGINFRLVEYFLVVDEKIIIFCDQTVLYDQKVLYRAKVDAENDF